MDASIYINDKEYKIYPRRYLKGYNICIYIKIRRPLLINIIDTDTLREMFDMRDYDKTLKLLERYKAIIDGKYFYFDTIEKADKFIEYLFALITVFKFQNRGFYISTNDRIFLYDGVETLKR